MKRRFGDKFQYVLIGLGGVATALFSIFFYRELFPEYKEYQKKFVALEAFRAGYTGIPAAPFSFGIKQIVFEKENKGPADVERCISCHVALEVPDYGATLITRTESGELKEEPNPNYIWKRLDEAIAQLSKEGKTKEAQSFQALKTQEVGEFIYDVSKVLKRHPLMPGESRPFEFHPIMEYGCVTCHNGNGYGLVTDRAHGPVFDGAYEVEEEGYKPDFLEKDVVNDPRISKIFNFKPGGRLIFQTSPIYVDALIEAKCVNCHNAQPSRQRQEKLPPPTALEKALGNYSRGEELFVSQGCYACHKIAGLSRGGVGPELTKEGLAYPWFVKESIVWPQADLKTSTMPNFRLDHYEIEDLLTFLLAQKGERRIEPAGLYRNKIANWEAGEKLAWEKPVSPAKVQNVDFGLTVFATEGCAACHRLKGFETQVALKRDPETFRSLIQETISGEGLYEALKGHKEELQALIDPQGNKEGLLDRIDAEYPGLIPSFYPAFRFAERKSRDPEYQALLKQVLKLYVAEYGLGRQIGPKPNWSGVYRSDQWLMSHFKNPQAESPRSLMPIFPFDETKFYALTHMLNVVGAKNRDALRKSWEKSGFDPKDAYQELCSQCHGEHLLGNGPVAEWIYPIPKNLRKGEFLRNLTREKVKNSIAHGVAGTPMPPWGEVAAGKSGSPVLSETELDLFVDWLFSFLSGAEVIREDKAVPKWQYDAEEVVEELKKEGAKFSALPRKWEGAQAAIKPAPSDEGSLKVSDLFDIKVEKGEMPKYTLKKKYYTPENLAAGEALFNENCASCHGKEGDGAGNRAEAMHDAKPRMLTNLNWLNSHDDLRLLQSIKFGVPGTAMQPWGDVTSGKQRIDLVLYIRSLSAESEGRSRMVNSIESLFGTELMTLEAYEATASRKLEAARATYKDAEERLKKEETVDNFISYKKAKTAYEQEEVESTNFKALRKNIQSQKSALTALGLASLSISPEIADRAADLIQARKQTIALQGTSLKFLFDAERKKAMEAKQKELFDAIESARKNLEQDESKIKGKIHSLEQEELLAKLAVKKQGLQNFKAKAEADLKLFWEEIESEGKMIQEKVAK